MKAMNVVLALVVACGLSFAVLSDNGYAASTTQDITGENLNTAKIEKSAQPKGTKTQQAKVEIPKNININSADKDTLSLLPGIGPAKADAILAYREQHGSFKSVSDLKNVKGIGDKTLEKLIPYLKKV